MIRAVLLLLPLLATGCIIRDQPLDSPNHVEPAHELVGDWHELATDSENGRAWLDVVGDKQVWNVAVPQWDGKPKGLMSFDEMLGFVVVIDTHRYLHLLCDSNGRMGPRPIEGQPKMTAEEHYKKWWLEIDEKDQCYVIYHYTMRGQIFTLHDYTRDMENIPKRELPTLLKLHGPAILNPSKKVELLSFVKSTGIGPGLRARMPEHFKQLRAANEAAHVALAKQKAAEAAKRRANVDKAIAMAKEQRLHDQQKQYAQLLVAKADIAQQTTKMFGPEQASDTFANRAKRQNFANNEWANACRRMGLTAKEAESLLQTGNKEGWPKQ